MEKWQLITFLCKNEHIWHKRTQNIFLKKSFHGISIEWEIIHQQFWRLKMHKTLSLILILFLNFGVLSASTDNITSESDMNVFNSGETISSSKMNENFEILKLSKTELVNIVNELRDNLTQISNQMIQLNSQLNSSNNNLFFPDG